MTIQNTKTIIFFVSKMNIFSPSGADYTFWGAVTDLLQTIPTLVDRYGAVRAFTMPVLPKNGSFLIIKSYIINNTHPGGQKALDELY